MSTIVDISIFPVDKEASVSPYVAKAVKIIRESGLDYQTGPMGTCIEGEFEDIMRVVSQCFENMKEESSRIYMTLKVDYRQGYSGRIAGKVKSLEEKLGQSDKKKDPRKFPENFT
jgi:uncharacterized protein (TIGR00106 family)